MLYETFARIYDEVMDSALYQQWLHFSKRHIPENSQRILELACGTGALAFEFAKDGYCVTALDLSEEMLAMASERVLEAEDEADETVLENLKLQFVQGDMLDLSEVGTYEVVTCFSDSLCYMQNRQEVQQVFDEVYNALEAEGTFIFDVHSLYQMDEIFPEYSYHYQTEDFAFLWDSYPGEKSHSIQHCLTFFVPQGDEDTFVRVDEIHDERTYSLENYLVMLESAGFGEVEVYADFTEQAPIPESRRWFFVAHKDSES